MDFHDRGRIVHAAGARVSTPIGPFARSVAAIAQDLMDGTDPECRSPARAVAALIEPLGGLFDAEWPRLAVTFAVETEDKMNEFGFDRIDIELFLDFRAALLRFHQPVAKWCGGSVPEWRAFSFIDRITCFAFSFD